MYIFLNWLFDWTFKAGAQFGDLLQVTKGRVMAMQEYGRLVKKRLFR